MQNQNEYRIYDFSPGTKILSTNSETYHLGCACHGICSRGHFLLHKNISMTTQKLLCG